MIFLLPNFTFHKEKGKIEIVWPQNPNPAEKNAMLKMLLLLFMFPCP